MILLDYSQTAISNIFVQIKDGAQVDIDFVRHMILNSIRSYRNMFCKDYGELVIAADAGNVWRKDIFPYYKFKRIEEKKTSEVDWNSIFLCLNTIRNELAEFFPYPLIHIDKLEADDVIGSIVMNEKGTTTDNDDIVDSFEEFYEDNPILIISGDNDFVQLQKYKNVKQYDPIRKKYWSSENPALDLKEKLIRGDSGDGVPNCLSPDNCFAMKIRQTTMTAKRFEYLMATEPFNYDDETKLRYRRNESLIDLSYVPLKYQMQVLDEYENQQGKSRKHLMNYFIQNRLKHLMVHINDY